MRLKELIAEYYYLKWASKDNFIPPFKDCDSNVRDKYHRQAYQAIPQLIAGYLSDNQHTAKIIGGCIKNFIHSHGDKLTLQNYSSLTKRIISNLRNNL